MPPRRVSGLWGPRRGPPGGFTPDGLAPGPGRTRVVLSVARDPPAISAVRPDPMGAVPVHREVPMADRVVLMRAIPVRSAVPVRRGVSIALTAVPSLGGT
jgi:hypothetical protein